MRISDGSDCDLSVASPSASRRRTFDGVPVGGDGGCDDPAIAKCTAGEGDAMAHTRVWFQLFTADNLRLVMQGHRAKLECRAPQVPGAHSGMSRKLKAVQVLSQGSAQ